LIAGDQDLSAPHADIPDRAPTVTMICMADNGGTSPNPGGKMSDVKIP
jgi:hypothetical protein